MLRVGRSSEPARKARFRGRGETMPVLKKGDGLAKVSARRLERALQLGDAGRSRENGGGRSGSGMRPRRYSGVLLIPPKKKGADDWPVPMFGVLGVGDLALDSDEPEFVQSWVVKSHAIGDENEQRVKYRRLAIVQAAIDRNDRQVTFGVISGNTIGRVNIKKKWHRFAGPVEGWKVLESHAGGPVAILSREKPSETGDQYCLLNLDDQRPRRLNGITLDDITGGSSGNSGRVRLLDDREDTKEDIVASWNWITCESGDATNTIEKNTGVVVEWDQYRVAWQVVGAECGDCRDWDIADSGGTNRDPIAEAWGE